MTGRLPTAAGHVYFFATRSCLLAHKLTSRLAWEVQTAITSRKSVVSVRGARSHFCGHITASSELISFVPDPVGRGTLGLLWACLSALLLSSWTALHLNIMPPGKPWLKRQALKIVACLGWLLIPELVLLAASMQL
jgi:hypothetical protein